MFWGYMKYNCIVHALASPIRSNYFEIYLQYCMYQCSVLGSHTRFICVSVCKAYTNCIPLCYQKQACDEHVCVCEYLRRCIQLSLLGNT